MGPATSTNAAPEPERPDFENALATLWTSDTPLTDENVRQALLASLREIDSTDPVPFFTQGETYTARDLVDAIESNSQIGLGLIEKVIEFGRQIRARLAKN
ncbi:MAG: hypothetical protein KDD53_12175 [Bdellovibrionales bacterium]|nr:hypothetical protein [Bdellovibrionales bacterium]